VLIGDGMINAGRTLADTFGARLADHLDGWCVANLGIAGHGPFQYLQTLKTYGTKKHPRFTILAFNEGNDLQDIGKYIAWKSGSPASFTGGYEVGIANPLRRFTTAMSETITYLRQKSWNAAADTVFPAIHSETSLHPLAGNLAVIRLPSGAVFPMVFVDREATKSPREIEQSGDWHRLEDLISTFKTICDQNGSIPAILFIPEAAHIYAQYSTDDSGVDWRDVRDSQVAAKMNLETAVTDLSRELGLRFVSLSELFENAARTGDVLYDSFSVHLTPRATEIAAQYVSEMLRSDPAARSISAKPQDSSSDVALSPQR